jgi:hypothetical protein
MGKSSSKIEKFPGKDIRDILMDDDKRFWKTSNKKD